jgi:leader peptidase (prepilin peptidase)/N-methyltransferase
MEAFLIFLFFLLGLEIGSFLNVCIDRLPRGESIVKPPSHCEACGHRLAAKDLIPLFSYLWLRGRCRYCRASIPRKLFFVELASGVIYAFLYWKYVLSPESPELGALGAMVFYAALFTIIFMVDLEKGVILNKIIYPAMAIAVILGVLGIQPELPQWPVGGIANIAMGGGVGFLFFFVVAMASRGGMGWGDVKLAGLIGLATGFPMVLVAIVLGAVLGAIIGVVLMAVRKKGMKSLIPFGPFLSVATMVTLIWGGDMLNWYAEISSHFGLF